MKFRLQDTARGSLGAIEIPTDGPGTVICAACGDDKADALAKAALLAERIAQDPVMSSIMPPEALRAIRVAKVMAAAAKRGPDALRSIWGRIRGPGKRRLARVLHAEAVELSGYPGEWMWAEEFVGDDGDELGILPFAVLAAKYGPIVARKMYAAYKRRKAAKRRAKAAKREREQAPEPEATEPEADNEESEPEGDDEGAES